MPNVNVTADGRAVDRAPLYQLAYQESQRNLTQQASVLDNIRTRAGLVITAANVVTAFLGAPAIKNQTTPPTGSTEIPGLTLGSGAALVCFALAGFFAWQMLRPWSGWNFRFRVEPILKHVEEEDPDETLGTLQRKLALLNDDSFTKNQTKIDELFVAFKRGWLFVSLEAVFWIASLAQARVLGVQL